MYVCVYVLVSDMSLSKYDRWCLPRVELNLLASPFLSFQYIFFIIANYELPLS